MKEEPNKKDLRQRVLDCNEGKHQVVNYLGIQETQNYDLMLGNCDYCQSTVVINERYRKINENVYELLEEKVDGVL